MRRLIILAEATHTFCYSRTIKGGITAGSVFIEFGNRVIYRCV